MTTRAALRADLRRKLEDTTATPLWDDAALNELLGDAVRQYGSRFPAERTAVLAVTDGVREVMFDPYLGAAEVLAVRDSIGRSVPRMRQEQTGTGFSGQFWRWWGGSLHLSAAAMGGDWQIDYLARREMADNDVDQADIRSGDEEIVVLMAAAAALLRRAVELSKRGVETGGLTLTRVADRHAQQAEMLIEARRRRAIGGWLSA